MKVQFILNADDIRRMICDAVNERTGLDMSPEELPIKVRSKQNYRVQEWETGEFMIAVEVER